MVQLCESFNRCHASARIAKNRIAPTVHPNKLPVCNVLSKPSFVLQMARRFVNCLPFGRRCAAGFSNRMLAPRGRPVVCRLDHSRLRFAVHLGETIDDQLFYSGWFEPIFTSLFLDLLAPGQTVFDVGANLGYYSLLAWERLGERGRVFAFEPDENSLARLRTNLSLNNAGAVELIEAAVSDKVGCASFWNSSSDQANQGGASLVGAGDRQVQVPTTSLDAFVTQRGMGQIDLLKMDIEGGEALAIPGMIESLRAGRVRFLLLEMHRAAVMRSQQSPAALIEMICKAGYRALRVRGTPVRGRAKYAARGQYCLAAPTDADYDADLAHYLLVHQQAELPREVQARVRQS